MVDLGFYEGGQNIAAIRISAGLGKLLYEVRNIAIAYYY